MTNSKDSSEKFESWAVVELFGHQRIAGKVTEATIGGCSFLRVDVPKTEKRQAYTKYFGNGAIYAMTPCDEEVGRIASEDIERYSVPVQITVTPAMRAKMLGSGESREVHRGRDDDEDEDDDDNPF
jgi:hypothetical protein